MFTMRDTVPSAIALTAMKRMRLADGVYDEGYGSECDRTDGFETDAIG